MYDVGGAHAGERIILRVLDVVGVVPLDEAAVLCHYAGELAGHFGIEEGGMQVGSDLAHHEAGPCIGAAVLFETCLEQLEETEEHAFVGKTAVDLFGAHFVGDAGQAALLAEILYMGDELDGAGCHHIDVDNLALGQETVDRGIDVNEVVAGEQSGFV